MFFKKFLELKFFWFFNAWWDFPSKKSTKYEGTDFSINFVPKFFITLKIVEKMGKIWFLHTFLGLDFHV